MCQTCGTYLFDDSDSDTDSDDEREEVVLLAEGLQPLAGMPETEMIAEIYYRYKKYKRP